MRRIILLILVVVIINAAIKPVSASNIITADETISLDDGNGAAEEKSATLSKTENNSLQTGTEDSQAGAEDNTETGATGQAVTPSEVSCDFPPTEAAVVQAETTGMVPLATASLPAGSTSADLQTAINSTASGDTIVISDDITFTDAVTIPSGKEITIQSDTGNQWTFTDASTRHFTVSGSLILKDIILDGDDTGGGVQVNSGGSFTMNSGAVVQYCAASLGGGVYMTGSTSVFAMRDGAIIKDCHANSSTTSRGGIYVYSGTFTLENGAVIQDCISGDVGGGVYMNGTLTMTGGTISGNFATATNSNGGAGIMVRSSGTVNLSGNAKVIDNTSNRMGGGISIYDSTGKVNLYDSVEISGNTSGLSGGGLSVSTGTLTMSGGTISGNSTGTNYPGGGVYVTSGIFNMAVGIIDGNAAYNGGGVYVDTGSINIDNAQITNNSAGSAGGGIYTTNSAYTNITTSDSTVFSGNTASALYMSPTDAATTYPNIGFTSVSLPGVVDHPLNNYDINYTTGTLIEQYTITVQTSGGGTAGASETSAFPGMEITLTATPDTGYFFKEWQVVSGGITINDNKFTMPSNDVTIMAIFEVATYTVSFESNGGSAVPSQTVVYGDLAVEPVAPTKAGHTFAGWYTDDNTFANACEPFPVR